MNEPIHRQSASGPGKHLQHFGAKLTVFLLCFKFCRAGAAGCPWPEGNLLHSPDYGLKVRFPSLICSDKCPCLSWPLRNLVLVTPRGPSHGLRALDGSGKEWCIPLSVQYPLLSGWELGWPFRALQTQPFMSRFHSQTTTMTLPSSSSSTTSSSPLCSHCVSPAMLRILCTGRKAHTRVQLRARRLQLGAQGFWKVEMSAAICAQRRTTQAWMWQRADHKVYTQLGLLSEQLSNW